MEIKTNAKFYKKKKTNSFYLSIASLLFIILVTVGLYFYNINIEKQINELNEEIATSTKAIENSKKDKNVIISQLYYANKSAIDKLDNYSNVSLFIKHLSKMKRVYSLHFTGFKYNNGKVSTNVLVNSDSVGINYQKTYNFITNYRNSEDALFNLEFVKSISTKDKGVSNSFSINLNLKDNFKEALQNKKKKKNEEELLKKKRNEELKEKLRKLKEKQKQNKDKE